MEVEIQSMSKILLDHVRAKGVRLWNEGGQLRFTARRGLLSPDELQQLKAFKGQILALLQDSGSEEDLNGSPLVQTRQGSRLAPLTYTQQADWQFVEVGELRRMRQVASAIRIDGPLRAETLAAGLAQVVRRHTALRTHTKRPDGRLMQEIDEIGTLHLELYDFSDCSERSARESEITRLINTTILASADEIETAPCAVRLSRCAPEEHVLIVAMDHMISDAYSMNVLLQELFAAYAQCAAGEAASLPEISLQFADFAREQQAARADWEQTHLPYWNKRLASASRLKFPHICGELRSADAGWTDVPVQIYRATKLALLEWSRLMQTTLVMSVLTAFIASVMQWCQRSDAVVQFQTDGRTDRRLTNTIGYFASVLHLRIMLSDTDTFVDLLRTVTEEYCRAYEHADASYLSAQVPRPELTRSTMFNWVPESNQPDPAHLDVGSARLHSQVYAFKNPALEHFGFDRDPVLQLFDGGDEVSGAVFFPLRFCSVPDMERFARHFMMVLDRMIARPRQRVSAIQFA